jgi:hypothetical protein
MNIKIQRLQNLQFLKGAILVVLDWRGRKGCLEKKKREQAPALHAQ